ncbi:MAG: DUF192 domain-containing protein [Halobacteriovoraceae bacterium]|jgi:uncharacterized protein|nr:DUF192 domain-containing protein [Halobacteriovoraceae bacterium]MBT5092774.1 DUF192 domain-containing protein [Halobacteriovoraceae bacterium]
MRVKVLSEKKEVLGVDVEIASTMFSRMKGLMFENEMKGYDGLLIKPCNQIHTFFMKYNIDVVFLDKSNKVVKVIENLKPWRLTPLYFSASKVLELKGNTIGARIQKGETLEVVCIS